MADARAPSEPKRVFVGVTLSEHVTEECVKMQAELADVPARFISPEDLHLTLVPPWVMTDRVRVRQQLLEALYGVRPFTLRFNRLTYGPTAMRPWLVWMEAAASQEIVSLKKRLMDTFSARNHVGFLPHVTLARFQKEEPIAHLRPVARALALSMRVESVSLFESPNGGGAGYALLDVVRFGSDEPPH